MTALSDGAAEPDEIALLREQIARLTRENRALREETQALRGLIESSADVIQRFDLEGTCIAASSACRAVYGYEPEELLGKSGLSFLHPEDHALGDAVRVQVATEGQATYTGRVRRKDGTYGWTEFQVSAVLDPETGVARELVTVARDVSARKQMEEALRASEAGFRALITGLQVGVVVQGPNTEMLLVNRIALELLGLTEEQMMGQGSFDPRWNVIHEDGSPFAGETHPTAVAIATRKPVRDVVMGVYRPVTEDRVWILVSAAPQLDAAGCVERVVCTFTDISSRKAAEELARAQALMLEEISTPLVPISDDVVAMPIIGTVDPKRAEMVLDTLLAGIAEKGARVAILDITGVSVVDTQVATTLVRAAQAARLLGAQVVLTGIRGSVAQTLVELGADLGDLVTRGTLQGGIAWALGRGARQ